MPARDRSVNSGSREEDNSNSQLLDERGLTCPVDRIGLAAARISELTYQSSFDPEKRTGEVTINVSLISTQEFSQAIEVMKDIFPAGLGRIASEGEQLGEMIVPPSKIGLATVSHVVVYGALLRVGIPVDSRFGAYSRCGTTRFCALSVLLSTLAAH